MTWSQNYTPVGGIATSALIAVIPVAAGLGSTGASITGPELFDGSRIAMLLCACLLWLGALAAWLGLRDNGKPRGARLSVANA